MFRWLVNSSLLIPLVLTLGQFAGPGAPDEPAFVPGELILRFSTDASEADKQEILAELGATHTRRLGRLRTRHTRISGLDVNQAVARFRGHPALELIEPNYIWHALEVPNDPEFDQLWGLRNTGQTGGTAGADISATTAWDVSTGNHDIVVGVIDTGVDYTHEDLADNIFVNTAEIPDNGIDDDNNGFVDDVRGWDCRNDDNDPFDDNGHGTHVAGTIGAVGNNGIGLVGVNWNVRIMPLKFLSASGSGTTADAIECLDYANLMGVRITNNSWGGGSFSQALQDAIQRSLDEVDALFVAAAGNSATNTDASPHYPSGYPLANIISVAATDHNDQLAGFSNYGPTSVDLAAPGVSTLSTIPGNSYGFKSGTSMASPHVAGAVALLMGRFPNIGALDAKTRILDSVDPLPALDGMVVTGGRLNAFFPIADPDDIPPDAINDLTTIDPNATRVTLLWTATGDDGSVGTASRYEVRYSTTTIDASNYDNATVAAGPPDPDPVGTAEEMTVTGLEFETPYFFAVKVFDEFGNASPISNVAMATTLGPPALSASPASLSADLLTGLVDVQPLTLTNSGAGEAIFHVEIEGATVVALNEAADGASTSSTAAAAAQVVASEPWATGNGSAAGVAVTDFSAAGLLSGDLNLLIVESGADVTQIHDLLEAFPGIAAVDVFSASVAVPTLENLLQYDSVMLVLSTPFGDPMAIGDVLADYVDAGGGLVMTLASIATGFNPTGRLLTGGYFPVEPGIGPSGSSNLGVFDASHPIMDGVTTAFGDVLALLDPAEGAEVVAEWEIGEPFVVTKGGSVVAVNIFVSGTGFWAGDVPLILHNAVAWSANAVTWLSTVPVDGVVPAGESLDVMVVFDAAALDGGDYNADILVQSDDPVGPEITVPATLHVTGAPDIGVSHAVLDYGTPFVGTFNALTLTVANEGTDLLTVDNVTTDDAAYTVDVTMFALSPGESQGIVVTFYPTTPGPAPATLTIFSDDPDEGELAVALQGEGLIPPDIGVSPASLSEALFTGEVSTQTLTIDNTGGSDLLVDLSVSNVSQAGAASTITGPAFLDENFEDGNFDDWIVVGGTANKEVTSVTAAAGTLYSYHEFNSPSGHFDGIYRQLGPVQPGYVSLWIRSGSTSQADSYFVVRATNSRFVGWIFTDDLGRFRVNLSEDSFVYQANTWYHIEFKEIDWVNHNFDYYVDDALIRADLAFVDSTANDFDRIDLYNFHSGSSAWWDQIRIAEDEAPDFVTIDPVSAVIPAGQSLDVNATFDAAGLFGGQYNANILLRSNDPDEQEVVVAVVLNVTGAADIGLSTGTLDFGALFVGLSADRTLQVTNTGTDVLSVSNAASDNAVFTLDVSSFDLAVGESRDVIVTFTPVTAVPELGTLTISSNDPDMPVLTVALQGEGLVPPDIGVSPASLSEALFTGEVSTQTLTINNTGGSDLVFDVLISGIMLNSVAAQNGTTLAGSGFDVTEELETRSDVAPEGYDPVPTQPSTMIDATVLIIQDSAPWQSTANEQILSANGIAYDLIPSSTVATTDLTPYRVVLVPSDQTTGFYSVLAAQKPKIDAFVNAGGILEFHAAGWGHNSGDASQITLPGGMGIEFHLAQANTVLDPDHPLVQAVPSPFFGNSASHSHFSFIPPQADLIVGDDVGDPNLVVYSHGAGAVVASGQTLEFGYDREQAAGIILANMIPWVHDLAPGWLNAEPLSGVVPAGGSLDLSVLFDAAGLFGGQYNADIVLRSNDPDETEVLVSVSLQVTAAADIDVSVDSLDFGSLFVGLSTDLTLTVSNVGTVDLIADLSSDHADFTADLTAFNLPPGQSRDIVVTFTPTSAALIAGNLSFTTNDPDEALVVVALQGEGLVPPDIGVSPAVLAESLFTGETSIQTLTIDNTGGNDLAWQAEVSGEGSATLEELFAALESNAGSVIGAIPNRFDFSGGVSGFSISDGGSDMFDGGNFLHTSIGGPLAYTGSQIVSSPAFGSGGRYFTWKGQGLFVLAADMAGVTQFLITGNLGADGGGNVDGTVLQTTIDGVSYLGFVKRVYNAGNDPSVNHLIIVEQAPGADHIFSTDTNNDFHQVFNIPLAERLYYLLYAGTGGFYIDDAATRNIMDTFLNALGLGPQWLSTDPQSGVVPAGGSVDVAVLFDAFGLDGGVYAADVVVLSNDPDEAEVLVPVSLQVTAAADIDVSADSLDFGSLFIGLSTDLTLTVSNVGVVDLIADLSSDHADFTADLTAFNLSPGQSREVVVTFMPTSAAVLQATLTFASNDPDEGSVPVALQGEGLIPPDIAVSPPAFNEDLLAGEISNRTLTLNNTGGSDLLVDLSVRSVAQTGTAATVPPTAPWEPGEGFGAGQQADARSDLPPAGYQWLPTPPSTAAGATVLIVQDGAPWGVAAVEELLAANGRTYDLIPATAVEFTHLATYDMIVVAGDQPTAFYASLATQQGKLDEYVLGGGALVYHGAGWGYAGGDASVVTLAGGVAVHPYLCPTNAVVDAEHPLVDGLPASFGGTLASHAWFSGAPSGAHQILSDDQGRATLLVYPLGAGRVVAGAQPFEFGYDQGDYSGVLLGRTLAWALEAEQPAGPVFLDENFEDGDFDDWVVIGGTANKEVTSVTAAAGTLYSYHEFETESGHFNGIYRQLGAVQPGYVSLWIRSGSTSQADSYFVVRATNSQFVAWIFAGSSGRFRVNSSEDSFAYEANTWYHIEFKDIDWVNHNFDYYVDNELIRADLAFVESTANDFDRVDLYNFHSGSQAWWDEIVVAEDEPPGFLTVDPLSAVIPAGQSLDVNAMFDATELIGGDYDAEISVTSNDPDEPLIVVPAHLHVTGIPDIALSDDTLNYGLLFIGLSSENTLTVSNMGTDVLTVSNVSTNHPDYAADTAGGFSLAVAESRDIVVTFTPSASGPLPATLTLVSDDPDEGSVDVTLSGEGVLPPDVDVSPTLLTEDLFTDEMSTQTLSIANTGIGVDLSWAIDVQAAQGAGLEQVLGGLNDNFLDVTDVIPNRYNFSGGDTGSSISDGGNDMFDGGNFLNTDFGSAILYSDDTILDSSAFGPTGRYFTRKVPGLFVLAADLDNLTQFFITGNLGADGGGAVDGVVLQARVRGVDYLGFVKRVYNAGNDPSVNHLIIVEDTPGVEHLFASNTNDDFHRVFNLPEVVRLYYLLYAGAGGYYIDDVATLTIMETFVEALSLVPPWLSVDPASGTVAAGAQADVAVHFDATDLLGADYFANLVVNSNDPDEPSVIVPVQLHVTGIPDIDLSTDTLDFGPLFIGLSAQLSLTVTNAGTDPLTISDISSSHGDFVADASNMILAIGETRNLTVTFAPALPGPLIETLTLHSNDPDEPAVTVALIAQAVEPPDIDLSPTSFDEIVPQGQVATRTLTVFNTGASDLEFELTLENATPVAISVSDVTALEAPLNPWETGGPPDDPDYSWPVPITTNTIFADDFEDGDFDGWIIAGGGVSNKEVTDATAADGTNYSYHEFSSPFGHSNGVYQILPNLQSGYVSFWIRSGATHTHDSYFVCNSPSGHEIVFFFAQGTGRFYMNGNLVSGDNSFVYQANTWYHVELRNVDFETRRFDYYVDETLIKAGVSFRFPSQATAFSRVNLYNYSSGSQGRWDEIVFAPEGSPTWLLAEPLSGVVPPGGSVDVTVTFDATDLEAGDYDATIVTRSNDPDEAEILVPVHLHAQGVPDIDLSTLSLDYGTVFIGVSTEQTLTVANLGSEPLVVSDISANDPDFSADPSSFVVPVGGSRNVTVTFSPTRSGPILGDLTIVSDDPDEGVVSVALSGAGLVPPEMVIDPAQFDEQEFRGYRHTRTLSVGNQGGSPLDWQIIVTGGGVGDSSLDGARSGLNQNFAAITEIIPNRFDFSGGSTGSFFILDGGNDMYNGGNFLITSLGLIVYSDDVIVPGGLFGPGGAYFTRKFPGLFVLAADLDGIAQFAIFGFLGANGNGFVDGTVLEASRGDTEYLGFVKRVWGTSSPSVNHLIIVEKDPAIQHVFPPLTFFDDHDLFNLLGTTRMYYLLYAGTDGSYIDNAATQQIMEAFLDALAGGASWLNLDVLSGSVPAGETQDVTVTFDAVELDAAIYRTTIEVRGNDPFTPEVLVPVTLEVLEPPDITVPAQLDFGTVFVGTSLARPYPVENGGPGILDVQSITSGDPSITAMPNSFTVPPNDSMTITLSWAPTLVGPLDGTLLSVASNDPAKSVVTTGLLGDAIPPPIAEVDPTSLEAALPPYSALLKTKTVRLSNTGGSELIWSAVTPGFVVSAVPGVGVVPAGGFTDIVLTLSSTSLGEGDYLDDVVILSNDPFNSPLPVPVTFHVREVTLALMDVDFTPKEGSNDVEIMLQLPAPYDVADVVISTVSIWGELFANPSYSVLEDRNGDGTRELYLRFDSVGFEKWAVQVDPLTVTLTGEVRDTVWFRGDEVVRFEVPELTYPDGGEFLISGESVSISWTECTGQSSRPVYEVWLSRDGSQTWTMLAGNVELDSFDWVVSGPITGQARVRVYAWEEGEVIGFSSSEGDFVIQLQLLPPAPLETLLVDKGPTDFSLTWQAAAVDLNHGPADFYRVLSSALAQGPFVELATTVGTSLDLPISTQTGNFLHYRVVPQNTAGEPPD